MEFEIDQSRFLSALSLAHTVADRRATMPVLANVLLRVADGELVISATDMMIGLTETVACQTSQPGSLTLGVRHLTNVIRTLPAGPVHIKSLDNSWAQILAGRSEFKLMGMSEADFPELPDAGGATWVGVASHRLIDLIDKCFFSVSTDEARVNLNGALFESDGKRGTMVSTDGHRLTKYSVDLVGPKLSKGIVIPRKGMDEIRKVLNKAEGECEVAVTDGYLFVRADALTLSVKLNNVTFPPYQQVVPKDHQRRAEVDRGELLAALRQAVVIAPEKTATVKLQLDKNMLKLSADNPELGAIHLDLGIEYNGSTLTAGFNATYLIEALSVMGSERAYLDFQGELDPCVLRPAEDDAQPAADFLAVVMPMRI